jgi:hypothetical protein
MHYLYRQETISYFYVQLFLSICNLKSKLYSLPCTVFCSEVYVFYYLSVFHAVEISRAFECVSDMVIIHLCLNLVLGWFWPPSLLKKWISDAILFFLSDATLFF